MLKVCPWLLAAALMVWAVPSAADPIFTWECNNPMMCSQLAEIELSFTETMPLDGTVVHKPTFSMLVTMLDGSETYSVTSDDWVGWDTVTDVHYHTYDDGSQSLYIDGPVGLGNPDALYISFPNNLRIWMGGGLAFHADQTQPDWFFEQRKNGHFEATKVPEPATIALMTIGAFGVAVTARTRTVRRRSLS
jgi:hypothetical protein